MLLQSSLSRVRLYQKEICTLRVDGGWISPLPEILAPRIKAWSGFFATYPKMWVQLHLLENWKTWSTASPEAKYIVVHMGRAQIMEQPWHVPNYEMNTQNIEIAYWSTVNTFTVCLVAGNRDIVGFGVNGEPTYEDIPEIPCPAVRFRENSSEIMALREKEKGDWHKLTLEEKKARKWWWHGLCK